MDRSRESSFDKTLLDQLLRELGPAALGAVMRRFQDFAAAEDAVQEALLAAALQWPAEGLPDHPRAWLIQVASRRLTDQLRSEFARRQREARFMQESLTYQQQLPPEIPNPANEDDTLLLLFMCCHPSLTSQSAIALTLRAVGGLTTAEIASAFLIPEAIMAQRISRAAQRIKDSGVPFAMPTELERRERLRSVLQVLYLIFNEGYTNSTGPALLRNDLANEAIRLARAVHQLLPDDCEVAGLLALMLLTDARRPARTGPAGELIPLAEQDRNQWDQGLISEGVALISETLTRGAVGPYQLQAAIAAVHDEAAQANATDWPQILALYSLLKLMSENPMVTLNHAIAAAMVHGPRVGLDLLLPLDSDKRLAGHYRLAAVRAHLYEMADDRQAAITNYLAAASRTTSIPERDYLNLRAAILTTKLP